MRAVAIMGIASIVLTGCACGFIEPSRPEFSPASFRPVDAKKHKTEQASHDALEITYQSCKAHALQAGLSVATPAPPTEVSATATVNVGNNLYAPLAQPYDPAASYLAGQRAGQIERAEANRNDLMRASFLSCMGRSGWVLKTAQ